MAPQGYPLSKPFKLLKLSYIFTSHKGLKQGPFLLPSVSRPGNRGSLIVVSQAGTARRDGGGWARQ